MKWILFISMILASCNIIKPTSRPTVATLDGSWSYDPDGYISSYFWEQINGSNATLFNRDRSICPVELPGRGIYYFKLTVVDNQGAKDSDTMQIKY